MTGRATEGRGGRVLTRLAAVTLHGFFRSIAVGGRDRLPAQGPVLVVSNHLNGLVDPVLMVHALRRVPRFVAKATLWRLVPLRPLLALLGLLPVARRQDRDSSVTEPAASGDSAARPAASVNVDTFAAANRALADGAWVAIFPEGTAHDEPHLLPFRTGAARMALGGRAEGARGVRIVPVGLTYDDKLALRSRVLAVIGEPIDLDAWVLERGEPTVDDADRDAVRDLTATIAASLAALTPEFPSMVEARTFTRAAEVALRSVGGVDGDVPISRVSALGARLGSAPPTERSAVLEAFQRYHLALDLVGIRDDELVSMADDRRLLVEAVRTVARTAGLAPWALWGTAVNALPYLAVRFAGRLARKPAAKGTLRVGAAIVAFPAAWVGAGWLVGRRRGLLAGSLTAVAAAVGGYATVLEAERFAKLRRAWRGAERRFDLRSRVDELLAARAALVDAVNAAAAARNEAGIAGRGALE